MIIGRGEVIEEKEVSNLLATLSKTTMVLKRFCFYTSHYIGLKPDFVNYLERMGILVNGKRYIPPVYI